jgi:DNA-binding GntR family transcriptional regulator
MSTLMGPLGWSWVCTAAVSRGPTFRCVARREVDRQLDEPVYLQIAGFIRDDIQSGKLEPRRPVPSIRTLCEQYGVARETATAAMRVLESEGLVRVVKGKGFYVTQH